MRNLWAIPDIHGRKDLLDAVLLKLHEEEDLNLTIDKIIFLGDYIDRGPESKAVLDLILKMTNQYPGQVIALAGNHEWLMIDGLSRGGDHQQLWLLNGGGPTLRSFAIDAPLEPYVKWLASLPLSHEEPGFFFSHAPVPNEEDRNSSLRGKPFTKQELIWTYHSPEDMYARKFEDKVGVCGHVHALNRGLREPRFYNHYTNYIFADAGCGCSQTAPLVAIEVKTRHVVYAWPVEAQTMLSAGIDY